MDAKKHKIIFWLFVLFAITYIFLTLGRSPDAQSLTRYGLSPFGARILSISVVAPYIAIWFIALYGYLKFKNYSDKIRATQDGDAMSKIADGLLALAMWMPISSIVSNIGLYIARRDANLRQEVTIFSNYSNLVLVLVAFFIIYQGTSQLPGILKKQPPSKGASLLPGVFLAFCAIYAHLTLTNPANQLPTGSVSQAVYYLDEWLLITTIIVPYMLVWYLGFASVLHIRSYLVNVKGPVYKKALNNLAIGILIAILSLISLRLLTALTLWFDAQKLWVILVIIYLLLVFIATGYILIARGAKHLQKIEEV